MLAAIGEWATPEGVMTLVAFAGMTFATVVAILNMLGKKEAAAQVQSIADQMKAKEEKIKKAVSVATTVIKGVEEARKGLDEGGAKQVADTIKKVANEAGVEWLLAPMVKSVIDNQGSVDAILSE